MFQYYKCYKAIYCIIRFSHQRGKFSSSTHQYFWWSNSQMYMRQINRRKQVELTIMGESHPIRMRPTGSQAVVIYMSS